MIVEKALRLIIENEPEHFWNTWNKNIPETVKLKWLKKFLKINLTQEEFIEFMYYKGWYKNLDEYKKSTHFRIINECLEFDIIPYFNNLKSTEFNREFKIWQLNRN
jgi:hypothetical protein